MALRYICCSLETNMARTTLFLFGVLIALMSSCISQDDALIKLQYDLYYIKNRSFFLDFSIMIKTLSTVLFMRGQ